MSQTSKNKSSLGEQLRLHHHHDRRRRRRHHQQHQHSPCYPWFLQFPVRDSMRRERVKKGSDRQQTTDNRRREKRGKDRETRSEIWRGKQKERKHVILFFELRLSTMKRAKKRKEREREKNSILFFAKKKGVTSILRQEVRGIIKVIRKSELLKYAGLFSMRRRCFRFSGCIYIRYVT